MSSEPHVVLITGAGGKLGRPFATHLKSLKSLKSRNYSLRALVRNASTLNSEEPAGFDNVLEWDQAVTDTHALRSLLDGVESVVHLASSASPNRAQNLAAHVSMPKRVLDQCVAAGVKRFIALSSIKSVAGEMHDAPVGFDTHPSPDSDYGRFKLEAERLVTGHGANANLASWILRLPMVYGADGTDGADGTGGFGSLQKAARKGWPIPMAADNRRSFLYAENLFASIDRLLCEPCSPGANLLHLADGDALSTKALFQLIAKAQGNSGRCITLPERWAKGLSGVPLIGPITNRLLGSLEFDPDSLRVSLQKMRRMQKMQQVSDWTMPFTAEEAVAATINGQ